MPSVEIRMSRLPFPFLIGVHTCFVQQNDETHRWEVLDHAEMEEPCWGYVQKDFLPPDAGMSYVYFLSTDTMDSSVWNRVQGERARRVLRVLENDIDTYPYREEYRLLGPNSNTFTKWVLDEADVDIELPWEPFGNGYG